MARGRRITEQTKMLVWGRAASRCQFRNCAKRLDHDLVAGRGIMNAAYLAHIVASDPNGRRGDPVLSPLLANDPTNIMLMCDPHHRVIDGEDTWRDYPVEVLRQMKRDHEDWVMTALSSPPDSRSHILQFSARVGPNETGIPLDDCVSAIMPGRTPAEPRPIEFKISGSREKDNEPNFYRTELRSLREAFREQVEGRLERGDLRHLSVFAAAPIPLLIELGRLVSDLTPTEVYQLHKEPTQWAWAKDGPRMLFIERRGERAKKNVALKLAISAPIADGRIRSAIAGEISIWELTCDKPNVDVMRHPEDLAAYRTRVRAILDAIRATHGDGARLSVFPAVPVSCAVELGRAWKPKAHPPFDVYDETAGQGFVRRHRIEQLQ